MEPDRTGFVAPAESVLCTVKLAGGGGGGAATEKHSTLGPVVGAAVVAVVLSLDGAYFVLPP